MGSRRPGVSVLLRSTDSALGVRRMRWSVHATWRMLAAPARGMWQLVQSWFTGWWVCAKAGWLWQARHLLR